MAGSRLTIGERVHRAQRIGVTFGRVYLGIKTQQLLARTLAPPDMAARWSAQHEQSAHALYELAIELRGLILKGCQFIGSRADVLPPEYVEVLSRLQDRVPAHRFSVVKRTVERELGKPIEEAFREFSETPIASASLAQVHEARLPSGERVAVKVQYPEIGRLVESDLSNLRMLFRAAGLIERDFDLMPLVEELGRYVPLELDFVNEAHNAEKIGAFFEAREDVSVPRVHWALTTRHVLVSDFVEGIKVSDADALRAAGVDTDALMQTLIEAYCEQILTRGFFHADPHPGNLIVQPGQGGDGRPRLVFIDFGLAKDLPPDFRVGVVALAAAMMQGSAEAMAEALLKLGFETREGGVDALYDIADAILEVALQMRKQSFVDPRLMRDAGNRLPELIRANPIVRIPSHVILLGRVVALLSGLGRTLEARVDMVRTILPFALASEPSAAPPPEERSSA
jgi:predicted unusual protein kinase regulating ubiquinone biosynthesis (AarF/ABC1/UbiB family)